MTVSPPLDPPLRMILPFAAIFCSCRYCEAASTSSKVLQIEMHDVMISVPCCKCGNSFRPLRHSLVFVVSTTCLMPLFTKFTSSASVDPGKDTTVRLYPCHERRRECWAQGYLEATVGVQPGRSSAVELGVLMAGDKHRDPNMGDQERISVRSCPYRRCRLCSILTWFHLCSRTIAAR